VECLLGQVNEAKANSFSSCHLLGAVQQDKDETIYEIRFTLDYTGLVGYKLRVYPYHKILCHPLETGFMKWV
jgi:starch phosphorylase